MQSIGQPPGMAQNAWMSNDDSARVLVRRPATEGSAEESAELELVSTQILKQILSSNDAENRKAVEAAAKTTAEGVLARDTATGLFEIIDEEELRTIFDSGQALPKLSRPSDVTAAPLHDYADYEHLSMVSADALRRVLDDDNEEEESAAAEADTSEFNPYCT
jgi:hypothetical protein